MNVSSNFNPEKASFSQMETIKTWEHKKYHNDEKKMKEIQKNISFEVRENPYSLNSCIPIQNNENDKRYFGKTFYAQPGIELECLKTINELSKNKENFIGLEIAAGFGLVSWKFPMPPAVKGLFILMN